MLILPSIDHVYQRFVKQFRKEILEYCGRVILTSMQTIRIRTKFIRQLRLVKSAKIRIWRCWKYYRFRKLCITLIKNRRLEAALRIQKIYRGQVARRYCRILLRKQLNTQLRNLDIL
jgi:hypothetical protein